MSNKEKYKLTTSIILLLLSMFFLSFAASPIYSLFCKVTGYGGTIQGVNKNSSIVGKKNLIIRFDSNIAKNLPWKFIPKQNQVRIRSGENILAFYYAENFSKYDIIGTAIYNVTPHKAGKYFNKIHCFCFEEQLLKAGQKMLMPVSFFIDSEIDDDPYLKDVDTITLSYSFYFIRNASL